MRPVYESMAGVDGIIFANPAYSYGMTARLRDLVGCAYTPWGPGKSLANKVVGIIAIVGSGGRIDVVKDLCFSFAIKRMLAGNRPGTLALVRGDINDKEAMGVAHQLGGGMAWLVGNQFEYPSGFRRSHFVCGTNTY